MKYSLQLILLIFCVAGMGNADAPKKNIKKKIEQQKKQLAQIESKEKSLYQDLREFAERSEKLSWEVSQLKKDLNVLSQSIENRKSKISILEKKISQKKKNIKELLLRTYLHGKPSQLRILVSGDSPSHKRQQRQFVKVWAQKDQSLMHLYETLDKKINEEKEALELNEQTKTIKFNTSKTKEQKLTVQRKKKKKLLALVVDQKSYYEKSIDELLEAQKNLQKLMKSLPADRSLGNSRFASMKGKLPFPVSGPLTQKYGEYWDARLKVKLYHKGVGFRAKKGTPIQAVFDGKVVYADWFTGYGRVVIVDHGSGFFKLYGHLSRILCNNGEGVTVGDSIGEVGDTDSFNGDQLYFELRNRGISENPWPWFDRS